MKSMAAIQTEFGKNVQVEEIDIPDPLDEQVVIKLKSTGVCHSQLHHMKSPSEKTQRPLSLGHEGTGYVEKLGKNVKNLKEGDKVIVTWVGKNSYKGPLNIPKTTATYNDVELSGLTFTWSQYTIVHENLVVKIKDEYPDDVSCIVGCAVLTGGGAVLHTANVKPFDSVAIYGMGGVGLSALKMASMLNAYPLIAVDIVDAKLEFAKEFGATHVINSLNEDPIQKIQEITSGGADYAFDAIGVKQTMEQILPSVRKGGSGAENIGGKAVLIGIPAVNEIIVNPENFMYFHKQYIGSLGATYPERDFDMYLQWHKEGKFPLDKLVTDRYTLEDIGIACDDLHNGKITGRAIVEF